jgi:cell division cycle 14
LNWIIKDKILAFAGPQYRRQVTREGCYTLTPSDYIPYFQRKNVGLVVRLNKKLYNENEFRAAGIDHFEQYYLDGSCPSYAILQKVVSAFETVPADKGFAVHCKAGLGRTGTCIGAYIMKHYKFTAAEVIGWMRICRPGMVIGPQQHYLRDIEQKMWYEGDIMRMRPSQQIGSSNIIPAIKDLSVDESQYDPDSDAVKGRVGQADELLERRIKYGHNEFRQD